jgi:cobalt/nickel transport system ATP-binding protein
VILIMDPFVIEALELEYEYEGIPALRGLTLRLPRARALALLGANGAGKSTLLLHLNGILRPRSGEVRIDGQRCGYGRRDLLEWRLRVGIVFQDPDDQLFAATVAQDVSFGPLNLGLAEREVLRRVEEVLTVLEISHLADRPTHQLSFGQKKRVALAGVLAMRPEVLLLDEPTAGLDPNGAEEMLLALNRLRVAGTTLVLATHDMDLAYAWADRVAVLHEGRLLGQGEPEAILGDAALLRTARLRMPGALEMARALRAAGVLPSGPKDLPRSIPGLCRALVEERAPAVERHR